MTAGQVPVMSFEGIIRPKINNCAVASDNGIVICTRREIQMGTHLIWIKFVYVISNADIAGGS